MKLKELQKKGRIAYRHNPKHFYGNSFRVQYEDGRRVIYGTVKQHVGKGFRVLGYLKPHGI